MKVLLRNNGITVADLRGRLDQIPDIDENGEPYTVWVGNGNGTSSEAKELWPLNKTANGCDILIESNKE